MTAITQAAFARQHSVSRAAVAKWKTGGYISMVDGLVDVEASDGRLRDFGLGRFNPQPPHRLGGVNLSTRDDDLTWTHSREYPVASMVAVVVGNHDDTYLAAREHLSHEIARVVAEAVVARVCDAAIECLDSDGSDARPRGYASWRDHPWFSVKPLSEEDLLELEAMHGRRRAAKPEEPVIQLPEDWGLPDEAGTGG